jgi:hypothetical protein
MGVRVRGPLHRETHYRGSAVFLSTGSLTPFEKPCLRRQRSHIRIVSGASIASDNLAGDCARYPWRSSAARRPPQARRRSPAEWPKCRVVLSFSTARHVGDLRFASACIAKGARGSNELLLNLLAKRVAGLSVHSVIHLFAPILQQGGDLCRAQVSGRIAQALAQRLAGEDLVNPTAALQLSLESPALSCSI